MKREIQGHPSKKEGERKQKKREGKKGKRRKEKEVDRCSQLRASVQGHTRERGVPECYIQEHPKRQRRKRGRVWGGRGSRGVPEGKGYTHTHTFYCQGHAHPKTHPILPLLPLPGQENKRPEPNPFGFRLEVKKINGLFLKHDLAPSNILHQCNGLCGAQHESKISLEAAKTQVLLTSTAKEMDLR